jgi:large subunit ribosomal protein L25
MAQITINATKRAVSGKAVSKLRKDGKIPAVLYGHKVTAQNLELSAIEFMKAFRQAGESTIVTLAVDGQNTPVLIHDVQNHYLTEQPIHIDFYAVNMTEKLTATVPIHFVGESQAVKALGGILMKNLSEVEVECLPTDLPSHLEVDISLLNTFEDAIRVSDLKISDKVEIKAAQEELVVQVTPPRSEEELKGLDEKLELDVTAVEGVVKPTDSAEAAGPDAELAAKKDADKPEKADKKE